MTLRKLKKYRNKMFSTQEKHFSKKGKALLHHYQINREADSYHGDSMYVIRKSGKKNSILPVMKECGISIQYDKIDNRYNFDDRET